MASFDIDKESSYEDTFGHIYKVDFSSPKMEGGQGVVIRTTEADLALKIIRDPDTNEVVTDDSQNEKYLDLRILPIPEDLHITLPQVALKGVEGYVMTLLNSMTEFLNAFATGNRYYRDALNGNATSEDKRLLNYFDEHQSNTSQKRREKIFAYMKTGGLRRRLLAYMKAAAILVRLHTCGLVYCDFSDKNVFISSDLNYKNVWLIDADNLVYSELLKDSFYTPSFVAPEIAKQTGKCSFYSDCFSFAVALFNTMFLRHPFDGDAYQNALDELGEQADTLRDEGNFAWILDSEDDSNNGRLYLCIPDKFILSEGLRELFQQIFSFDAAEQPTIRPTMIQWAGEVAAAFDNVVHSKNCELDYLADAVDDFSICPFDDLQIPSVCLKSYLTDEENQKLAEIWKFTHELDEKEIPVPLRILNGFFCREIEKNAFYFKFEDEKIFIQAAADSDYSFSFKDGANGEIVNFGNYGTFKVAQEIFSIKCRHKSGRIILVEGERHG